MIVERVKLYQLEFPLLTPYKLSSGDLIAFDPIVVEVRDADGREGWGEALIIPGYAPETVEQAWGLCCELGRRIAGMDAQAARRATLERRRESVGAASA